MVRTDYCVRIDKDTHANLIRLRDYYYRHYNLDKPISMGAVVFTLVEEELGYKGLEDG